MTNLQQELQAIQQRNQRVEIDKAWEGSKTRKVSLMLITFAVAAAVLFVTGVENPLLGAVFPPLGYFISTLSLPFLKKWWVQTYQS